MSTSRQIARNAIRAEIARTSLDLVLARGFDAVTIDDMAAAAGVSRSTLIRYVGTKEGALLSALSATGDEIARATLSQSKSQGPWTALQSAITETVAERAGHSDAHLLALTRTIHSAPALTSAQREQTARWRGSLADALTARDAELDSIEAEALASAALACLDVAAERWVRSEGELTLSDAVARAFSAVAWAGRRDSR